MPLQPSKILLILFLYCASVSLIGSTSLFAQSPLNDQRVLPLRKPGDFSQKVHQLNQLIPAFSNAPRISGANQGSSCDTWTFQLKLGNAASVEKVNDMLQLPSGEYIVVGSSSTASGENGLIVKLDKQGNLLWSKTLEQATYDVTIKKIKLFSDGLLYAMVEIKPIATTITTPVLSAFDQNGNLQWANTLAIAGFSGSWKGVDVQEWRENSFSVVISNDSLFNVTRLSTPTRSTIWSKTYKSRGNLAVTGIGNEYSQVFVAYNETDSGFRRGVVSEFDYTTGSFRSGTRIGGVDGSDYFFQSMRMINLRPRISGYTHRNGSYELFKLNYNYSTSSLTELFSVNGLTTSNQLRSTQDDWTEKIGIANASNPADVFLVSTFPDNYYVPISAHKISYTYPVELKNMIYAGDGGTLIASNSLDAQADIVFTKVDSIAILPGCSSTPVAASFTTRNVVGYIPNIPQLSNVIALSQSTLSSQSLSLQSVVECKNTYCPDVKEPDSCLGTFFKEYRNAGNCLLFSRLLKTNQNKIMVLGRGRVVPYIAGEDQIYFSLFDTAGKQLDARTLEWSGSNTPLSISQVIKLKDGNYLAVGTVVYGFNSLELLALKFDEQFNIIWSQRMLPNLLLGGIGKVIESTEGDLYCFVTGTYGTAGQKKYLLKLNSTGAPTWFKSYDAGPNNFSGDIYSQANLLELGPYIYMEYREEEDVDWGPRIMKLNKSDGSVVWAKKISIPNSVNWDVLNFTTDQQNLYLFSRNSPLYSLIKLSADGDVLSSKKIGNPALHLASAKQINSTSFILGVDRYANVNVTYGTVEIDTAFNSLRDQFVQIPKNGGNVDIISYSDSTAYGVGYFFFNNDYWVSSFLQKFNFNSSFGSCEVSNLPLNLQDYPLATVSYTNTAQNLVLPVVNAMNLQMNPYLFGYAGFFCGKTACTSLDLTGPASICDSVNTYDFRITKNADCYAPTNWELDTTLNQIKIITVNDTLLRIKAVGNGNFKIKSKIFASCDWIVDSTMVSVGISATTLNLGPDSVICPGNTIVLNARSGFSSYKWQDGTTDSIYLATQPGTYFVEVSSTCSGVVYRDTVIISPHAPIPLSVGPDRAKCNNDTLHLNATAGFLNYSWSPNYNISSTSAKDVVINPRVDTAYFLKAEKTPGCFAFDTIAIKVHQSPSINLGPDVSFCQGDSVTFDAGANFSSYQWNTGAVTQQLTVKVAGQYNVAAFSIEGCKSFDTAKVNSVFSNPVISLIKDPEICEGTSKLLNAGPGFISYLWNDGSSGPTKTVSMPGIYFVTVTDQNGCMGSDTSRITTILPPPKNFLPMDTSICSYGKLELLPAKPYASYLWNNNASSKSITISNPGLYWLQVTDEKNCKGKDSILVKRKDCMSGFFVPNAFTPKLNSHNADFKPLVFGNVKKFEFAIYNRWGQMVYHTTELFKGWNGQLAGKDADPGTYVWSCVYQFEGEEVRMEKGTVLLIR